MVKVNTTQGLITEKLMYTNPGRETMTVIFLYILSLKVDPVCFFQLY